MSSGAPYNGVASKPPGGPIQGINTANTVRGPGGQPNPNLKFNFNFTGSNGGPSGYFPYYPGGYVQQPAYAPVTQAQQGGVNLAAPPPSRPPGPSPETDQSQYWAFLNSFHPSVIPDYPTGMQSTQYGPMGQVFSPYNGGDFRTQGDYNAISGDHIVSGGGSYLGRLDDHMYGPPSAGYNPQGGVARLYSYY